MSKEYYKKRLIDLRTSIAKEREAKKKDNAYYANLIKGTSNLTTKTIYRKSKIDKIASHDHKIESLKREIERTKESLKRV